MNFGDDVGVGGVVLHGLRRSLHVHGADAGLSFESNGNHLRVTRQPGNVIDDFGSGGNGGAGDGGFGGVDGEESVGAGAMEHFDHGNDAAQLLVSSKRRGIGPGALAADVQDGGHCAVKYQTVLNRRFAA